MVDRDSLKSALIKGRETLVFLSVSDELLHLASSEMITFGLCVQSITLSSPPIIGENQNTDGVSQCQNLYIADILDLEYNRIQGRQESSVKYVCTTGRFLCWDLDTLTRWFRTKLWAPIDHLYKQACWLFERVKGSASFQLCVEFLLICACKR